MANNMINIMIGAGLDPTAQSKLEKELKETINKCQKDLGDLKVKFGKLDTASTDTQISNFITSVENKLSALQNKNINLFNTDEVQTEVKQINEALNSLGTDGSKSFQEINSMVSTVTASFSQMTTQEKEDSVTFKSIMSEKLESYNQEHNSLIKNQQAVADYYTELQKANESFNSKNTNGSDYYIQQQEAASKEFSSLLQNQMQAEVAAENEAKKLAESQQKAFDSFNSKNLSGSDMWIKQQEMASKEFSAQLKAQMQAEADNDSQLQKDAEAYQKATEKVRLFQEQVARNIQIATAQGGDKDAIATYAENADKITAASSDLNNKMKESDSEYKNIRASITKANAAQASFGDQILSDVGKFALWTVASTAIMQPLHSIEQGIKDVIDLNTNLSMTAEAMQTSVSKLSTLASSAQNIASSMGASVSDVLNIAHIYANAETSLSETIEHTKAAVELMNISGLSSSDASDALQGVQQAFDISSDKLEHVNDVMATLASNVKLNYQTAIQDMSQAISTAGMAANESGLSLEQYLAVTVKVAETTRQTGDTIANAEKTIFARVGQSKKAISELGTTSDDISNAAKALKSVANVDVMDQQTGKMRDMNSILSDLSSKWDTLSTANKNYVAYAAAGRMCA